MNAIRRTLFDRCDRASGNEAPGSGLGLAIVNNIAGAHGASVTRLASVATVVQASGSP